MRIVLRATGRSKSLLFGILTIVLVAQVPLPGYAEELNTTSDQALIPELELIKEEETVSIASRHEQPISQAPANVSQLLTQHRGRPPALARNLRVSRLKRVRDRARVPRAPILSVSRVTDRPHLIGCFRMLPSLSGACRAAVAGDGRLPPGLGRIQRLSRLVARLVGIAGRTGEGCALAGALAGASGHGAQRLRSRCRWR